MAYIRNLDSFGKNYQKRKLYARKFEKNARKNLKNTEKIPMGFKRASDSK